MAENQETTALGTRYVCENCGSQFLVTQVGNLPVCCDAPVTPA